MSIEQFTLTSQTVLAANALLGAVMLVSLAVLGLLISAGNRRVQLAIEEANQQLARWSAQDLRLKRGRANRELEIPDSRAWVAALLSRTLGGPMPLAQLKTVRHNGSSALIGIASNGYRWALSPLSAAQLRRERPPKPWPWRKAANHRLTEADLDTWIPTKPERSLVRELSILNAGLFFDLEAQQVWQREVGEPLENEVLYLYRLPRNQV